MQRKMGNKFPVDAGFRAIKQRAEISRRSLLLPSIPLSQTHPQYIHIFFVSLHKKVESQRSLPMELCAWLSMFTEYNACLSLFLINCIRICNSSKHIFQRTLLREVSTRISLLRTQIFQENWQAVSANS